jgi:hypothetical protein
MTYDVLDREVDRTYHNPSGARVARIDGGGVIWRWHREYDRWNRVREESFFGIDNAPVEDDRSIHRVAYEYNRFGEIVKERWFNKSGAEIEASATAAAEPDR